VGHGHRRRFLHGRVGQQQVLDLLGGDLLAAPVDEVLGPAFDGQVAAGVAPDDVARPVEAVGGEGAGVVRLGPVVAPDRVRAPGEELARLAVGHRLAVGPDDQDLVGRRQRPALRLDHDAVGVVEPGVVEEPLGHPEHLLHPAADGRADAAGDLRHEAGSADLEDLEAGEVEPLGGVGLQPPDGQRRHEGGDRDLLGFDDGHGVLRLRRRRHDDPPAGRQGAHEARAPEREVVGRRQGHHVDGGRAEPGDLGRGPDVVGVVVVGPRDELRQPGRAARQQEEGNVARVGRVGVGRCPGLVGIDGIVEEAAEVHDAIAVGVRPVEEKDVPQRRRRFAGGGAEGAVPEAAEGVAGQVGGGLRVLGEIGDLVLPVRRQGEDRQHPEAQQGEAHGRELDDIGQLHHDPVAPGEAEAAQAVGQPVGGGVELGVAHPLRAAVLGG
jgi:hypothetical protein